jgi:hypothetical protein
MALSPVNGPSLAVAAGQTEPVAPATARPAPPPDGAVKATKLDPAKLAKLTEAARQFEAVFVRHLLKSARFGGDEAAGGYGAMVVDAMATSVTSGGGLGLARAIRDSLLGAELRRQGGR